MTEQQVITLVAETLGVPIEQVSLASTAGDFPEWDSMGTLSLMTMLAGEGIQFDPGDTGSLQTVQGIVETFGKEGKLS